MVVIPARDEEFSLAATLDAFAEQKDGEGRPLDPKSFEICLLLNNCKDDSVRVAAEWKDAHSEIALHVCERTFQPQAAHVGTARNLLMDTAWRRLSRNAQHSTCGILSTDADTVAASDWVTENLRALEAGADAVGGAISLHHDDYAVLPMPVRVAYEEDRLYQKLIAELEDRMDPQAGDPWPRHLEHFGASLACTPSAYARAGGMPAVTPLEDVAFVDALRRMDARLRHEPRVRVSTSARLYGRVEVGLSGQLREWHAMSDVRAERRVPSGVYLAHRFGTLRALREAFTDADVRLNNEWTERVADCRVTASTCGQFLADLDCNRLIDETFHAERQVPISEAVASLREMLLTTNGQESIFSSQLAY